MMARPDLRKKTTPAEAEAPREPREMRAAGDTETAHGLA